MNRLFKPSLRLVLGLALPMSAAVADPASSQSSTSSAQAELTEVTVWGTQIYASSVDLDQEAIAIKQADHLSDLLRTIPGIDVGGAHSLNQRITIRSMDDKDLRITIDGANQNTYMYHHMGNLQIHADILQSVAIEVGTNSVVDGGLGGTVRFKTKDAKHLLRPGQQWGGRAKVGYADNAADNLALTGYGQILPQLDALLYYNRIERGNYEVGGGEIKDNAGAVIAGTDGQVRGLEGSLDDALLKVGWDFSASQRLEIGYEAYADQGDYSYRPDMGLATDIAIGDNLGLPLTYDTEFTRDTLTLNYEASWGDDHRLNASVFSNESQLWRDESAIQAVWPGDPALVEGIAENTGFNVLANSYWGKGDRHELTYGVDLIRYETQYRTDGVDRSAEDATSSALFIQDRIALGRFALIPGVRYNHYELDAHVASDSYSKWTGALAAEYEITPALLLKLSSTQLFKGPEIGEVFIGAGSNDTANPDISAETGRNSELSLAYENRVLNADRFAAGFTLFRTRIDAYIYDYAAPPAAVEARYWKDNVGDMTITGGEAYVGYDRGPLSALLTYSDAESDLQAFAGYSEHEGARLDRQQGDTLSFNLDYRLPSLGLLLHWDVLRVGDVAAGPDLDGATLDNSKDGYSVHNVSARWTPESLQGLALTLGVDNLFDEYYASQSSRTGLSNHPRFGVLQLTDYEPGRNVKITASYQW